MCQSRFLIIKASLWGGGAQWGKLWMNGAGVDGGSLLSSSQFHCKRKTALKNVLMKKNATEGGGGNFAQDWHINPNTDGFCSVRTEVWRVATWSYGLVSTLSFCGRDAQKPEIIISMLLWEQEIWAREFHWIEMFYRGVDLINRRIITLTDPDIPLPWGCMKMHLLLRRDPLLLHWSPHLSEEEKESFQIRFQARIPAPTL